MVMTYHDKNKEKTARLRAKRKYYETHKDEERRKSNKRITTRRALAYEHVNAIKSSTPCADCKRTFDPICMDFDHCKGDPKVANVSRLINLGSPLEKIQAEMIKCELVCANCHRIRTRDRT